MKLEFRLLVVDDYPDGIGQAIESLSEYLETKGFSLDYETQTDFSEEGLSDLTKLDGKNYDLVMVDYNLGQPDIIDGAGAAEELRRELPYTDMIFYSSMSERKLLGILAKHFVPGVFVARRDDLDEALTGLADTIIGKAVDLNHMRGIAMAEVAEMDVLMEEALGRAFQPTGEYFAAAAGRTTKKLRESMQKSLTQLDQCLEEGSLADVVRDSRLFSSTHKYRAVGRVANFLSEKPTEALQVLKTYQKDIIENRNMLAHAKEYPKEDGTTILRSIRNNRQEVIDDSWMTDFRQKLTTHRNALTTVCEAIDRYIDATEAPRDSE